MQWVGPMARWRRSRVVLLACFVSLLPRCSWEYDLREEVTGQVSAGDARFYNIDAQQSVVVALLSEEGDADIYASTSIQEPSSESYDYSSVSCGMDVIVIPLQNPEKVHIAVCGHVRYESTSYRLYLITPSEEDIRRYQVWDWDPETQEKKLLIDADPLVLANDPALHQLLDALRGVEEVGKGRGGHYATLKAILDWTGFLILKTLEIAVEVLL